MVIIVSIFLTLIERLELGFTTLPGHFDRSVAISTCIYILFALMYGWRSQFLRLERSPSSSILRVVITSLIAPALLEEAFFRVLLLPYPDSDISSEQYFVWSVISLLLFIIYHPLNALTAFPQGRKVFSDRRFLILATALGIVCTVTYWQTGSVWLPILIHWLTVVLWLLCFGGLNKLNLNLEQSKLN